MNNPTSSSQKPSTYKHIAIITLACGLLTNYYAVAITFDAIRILLASLQDTYGSQTSVDPANNPLAFLLPLAPVSLILLLVSLLTYIQYRRTASKH